MFCPIRIPFKPNEINYLIQLLISATETLKEFEKYAIFAIFRHFRIFLKFTRLNLFEFSALNFRFQIFHIP